jgi:hypothetical protein
MTDEWPYWVVETFCGPDGWQPANKTLAPTEKKSKMKHQVAIGYQPYYFELRPRNPNMGDARCRPCRIEVKP